MSLSLYGNLPLFLDDSEGPTPPVFPTLRYLSMAGFSDYPANLFERLAIQAPNLTHLYLMPSRPIPGLQQDFQSTFSTNSDSHQRDYSLNSNTKSPKLRLPWQSIQLVYIQAAEQSKGHVSSSYLRWRNDNVAPSMRPTTMVGTMFGRIGDTFTAEAARKQWIDAEDERSFIPMRCLSCKPPIVPARVQIFTSTTKTVTYDS